MLSLDQFSRSLIADEFRDHRLDDGNHKSGGGSVRDPHTAIVLLHSVFIYDFQYSRIL